MSERMMENIEYNFDKHSINYGLDVEHLEYLIKQAQRNVTAQKTVEILGESLKQSMEENKRYREAIERIKDNIPLEFEHGSEHEAKKNVIRLLNIQSEVDKALEGDSDE